jgi:hypothetical protein
LKAGEEGHLENGNRADTKWKKERRRREEK